MADEALSPQGRQQADQVTASGLCARRLLITLGLPAGW